MSQGTMRRGYNLSTHAKDSWSWNSFLIACCFWYLYYFFLKKDILLEHNVGRHWKEALTKKENKGSDSYCILSVTVCCKMLCTFKLFQINSFTWAGVQSIGHVKKMKKHTNVLASIVQYLPKCVDKSNFSFHCDIKEHLCYSFGTATVRERCERANVQLDVCQQCAGVYSSSWGPA